MRRSCRTNLNGTMHRGQGVKGSRGQEEKGSRGKGFKGSRGQEEKGSRGRGVEGGIEYRVKS
jgi:hypothetical protein